MNLAFKFQAPKKKKWTQHPHHLPPLPITLEDFESGGSRSCLFTGQLHGSVVLVSHSGDMDYLYNRGFFGTCSFPRAPSVETSSGQSKINSKRKYLRHIMHTREKSANFSGDLPTGPFIHALMSGEIDEEDEEVTSTMNKQLRFSSQDTNPPTQPQLSSWNESACDEVGTADAWEMTTQEEAEDFWNNDDDDDAVMQPILDSQPVAVNDNVEVRHNVSSSVETDKCVALMEKPEKITKEHSAIRSHKPAKRKRRDWESSTIHHHYLQISLEEAFFLSFGLGCLVVADHSGLSLTIDDLWKRCCSLSSQFIPRYITYHHLRSKGWVPKAGLKFGADFLLYKKGPPFYHASYSVVVQAVNKDDLSPLSKRQFSWTSLACLNRVTEQVNKEVMFVYVALPSNYEDLEFQVLLQQVEVKEVVLRRWISKHERENIQHFNIP